MNASRNKHKHQNSQLNSQLENVEVSKELRKRQKALYLKISEFLLDLAKLVFGGIILTGIIDLDLDKMWLFALGTIVAAGLAWWGFIVYQRGIIIKD